MIAVSCLFEQLPASPQQQQQLMRAAQKAAPQLMADLQKVSNKLGIIGKLFGSVPQGQEGAVSQMHPIGSAAQKINQAFIRQLQQR